MPKMMAKNSTCSTSLRASASNEVVGMMLRMKAADAAALQLVGVLGVCAERVRIEAWRC